MKNKPLLFAAAYAVIYIAVTLFFFFTENFKPFNLMYLVAMAAVLPMVILTIKVQRDGAFGGVISGRAAAKEGMRFVFYATLFLVVFQVIFFYAGWKEFKTDAIPSAVTEAYAKYVKMSKHAYNAKELQTDIDREIQNVTLFKEVTMLFFRMMIAGFFSSFIAALFMKTTGTSIFPKMK